MNQFRRLTGAKITTGHGWDEKTWITYAYIYDG